ncbi:hypothetical protein ACIBCT_35410 [Streptosporangium sp. NPDC050855]|uniref:hypothetical protein n=1 Tax=Streptosporangium sp. NPDC050855 TaxID=3366194 RepID=UPI0037A1033E
MGNHYEVSIEVEGRRIDIAQVHDDLEAKRMGANIAQSYKPEVRECRCDGILF